LIQLRIQQMARKYSLSKLAPKKHPHYCIDGP
jgi:hypothetical protein